MPMRPSIGETTCNEYDAACAGDEPTTNVADGGDGESGERCQTADCHGVGLLGRLVRLSSSNGCLSTAPRVELKETLPENPVTRRRQDQRRNESEQRHHECRNEPRRVISPRHDVFPGRNLHAEQESVDEPGLGMLAVDRRPASREAPGGSRSTPRVRRGRRAHHQVLGRPAARRSNPIGSQPSVAGSVHGRCGVEFGRRSRRRRSGRRRDAADRPAPPTSSTITVGQAIASPIQAGFSQTPTVGVLGDRPDPAGDEHLRVARLVEHDVPHAEPRHRLRRDR